MDEKIINEKMHELEEKIKFKFRNIKYLSDAMYSIKIEGGIGGDNNTTYKNEALAQVGDAIIKLTVAIDGVKNNYTKAKIDEHKKRYDDNKKMHVFRQYLGIEMYAYNEYNFYDENKTTNKPPMNNHDQYIEAIIAAIYFDSGIDEAIKWINENLIRWVDENY